MGSARPRRASECGLAAPALVAALIYAGAGVAQPVAPISEMPSSESVAVLDIRDEDSCLDGSLPDARCLPASWLFDEAGNAISFHALRWLLGTVGLTGRETLVIYPGPDAPTPEDWAAAALVYLAGQAQVALLEGVSPGTGNGWPRSFSREAVFTEPMRVAALTTDADATPLQTRLAGFARGQAETVSISAQY